MKNLFSFSVLALLLFGCDGGAGDPNDIGSGRLDATTASTPDAVPSGSISCPIPASKYLTAGKVPSDGYRLLVDPEHFTCSTFAGYASPTDCSAPVDGFASILPGLWCCVNTVPDAVVDRKTAVSAHMNVPSLQCMGDPSRGLATRAVTDILGKVALCSSDGRFMGWDCNI